MPVGVQVFKEGSVSYFDKYRPSLKSLDGLAIHPLLFGRVLSMEIYDAKLKSKRIAVSKLIRLTKKSWSKLGKGSVSYELNQQFSIIYILYAFVLSNKIGELVEFIEGLGVESFLVSDYWSNNVNNHIKIYFSIYHQNKQNTQLAKNILDSVNPDLFPSFECNT